MGVADHQPHAAQPTRVERAQEGQPAAALVATGGGDLHAQHAALAGGADADRDERGHAHHPASLAHLVIERVERHIRVARRVERAAAEGVDLGVQPGADAADLALGQVGYPQRADQLLDAAGADTANIGLLHHAQQRALGATARLEQAGEVAPVAQLGNLQLDRADARVPAPLAIAVALTETALRCPLPAGRSDLGADLGIHQQLGQHRHPFLEKVQVAIAGGPAQQLEGGHPSSAIGSYLSFDVGSLTPTS